MSTHRPLLRVLEACLLPSYLLAAAPTSVTLVGSLQSEAGCPSDWDPTCTLTHLTYDAGSDAWRGTFALPSGSYDYKVALDDSWNENYGANGAQNGANIPLGISAGTAVRFYYDHKTHWATSSKNAVIATVPGSFQSELGCTNDWDPACLRSWLEDVSGSGTYSFTATLPEGSFECKVAIDESFSENYGAGGVPNGSNIAFSVPSGGALVFFTYDAATHVLTVCPDAEGPAVGAPPSTAVTQSDCQ